MRIPRSDPSETYHPWDCEAHCLRADGSLNTELRERRGCKRLDLPVVKHRLPVVHEVIPPPYMGRPPDRSLEGTEIDGVPVYDWKMPPWSLEETGCPGSYLYTRFIAEIMHFVRHQDTNGNRIPALMPLPDDVVLLEAVEFYEQTQRAVSGYLNRLQREEMAKAKNR